MSWYCPSTKFETLGQNEIYTLFQVKLTYMETQFIVLNISYVLGTKSEFGAISLKFFGNWLYIDPPE